MDAYELLLAGSFLSCIAFYVSIFYASKVSTLFVLIAIFVTSGYIIISHFDTHSAIDILRYSGGYYSDLLTNWHYKEIGFWILFRLPRYIVEVEYAYAFFDFIGIVIFYFSFRLFGVRPAVGLSAALVVFYFFPFVFGRHNIYRQYLAEIFGVACTLRFAYMATKKSGFSYWYLLLFIPATVHNAAIIMIVNLLLMPMKLRYLISTFVVTVFGTAVLVSVLGESSIELISQKITRERYGSGSIDAEYIYLLFTILFAFAAWYLTKNVFGKSLVFWLLGLELIIISVIILSASIYGERLGMYVLVIICPIILLGLIWRKSKILTLFFLCVVQVPLLAPTVSYLVAG